MRLLPCLYGAIQCAMPAIANRTDALRQLRTILESMRHLGEAFGEVDMEEDEGSKIDSEQEIIDRILEDATELGMDEEGLERIFRLIISYGKKSAE